MVIRRKGHILKSHYTDTEKTATEFETPLLQVEHCIHYTTVANQIDNWVLLAYASRIVYAIRVYLGQLPWNHTIPWNHTSTLIT